MKFKILIICISIYSCNKHQTSINNKYIYYNKVSLEKVIENPSQYDNKKIEIEGYYSYSMEDSSISSKNKTPLENSIWVAFNFFKDMKNQKNNFLFKNDNLLNFKNKKVKIRGIFSSEYKGHMSWYKGSIKVEEFIYKNEKYVNTGNR
ncbi:hypothetical protein N9Q58_04330 [Polaribacter sp.]|nr:hypothetical protein [Polaribacter sp.]